MKLKDMCHNEHPHFMKVIPILMVPHTYIPLCVCVSMVTPTHFVIIHKQCLQEAGVVIQGCRVNYH